MNMFLRAMFEQAEEEQVIEGISALVSLYYSEYTDATEIDATALHTLFRLNNLMADIGYGDFDLEAIVRKVERDIRESGRNVRTFQDDDE